MISTNTPSFDIETVIRTAIQSRTAEIAEEEILVANKRIAARVREETDRIALKVLGYYEIAHDHNRVIITVKKDV